MFPHEYENMFKIKMKKVENGTMWTQFEWNFQETKASQLKGAQNTFTYSTLQVLA